MKQDDLNMRKILESGALAFNSGDEPASGYTQANRVQLKPFDDNDADDLPGDTVTVEIDNEMYELTPDEVALIKMITSKRNDERLGVGEENEERRDLYSMVDTYLNNISKYVKSGKFKGEDLQTRAKDFIMSEIAPLTSNLNPKQLAELTDYVDKTLYMIHAGGYKNPLRK